MEPHSVARFLVTAFFAVIFLQSSFDKLTDREGNLSYLKEHFGSSPFPAEMVPLLLWALTVLEATAGILCAFGLLFSDFSRRGSSIAAWGLVMAGLALLSLMAGQRLAKDYAGAAVIAAYFAVVLVGLSLF